MFEVDVGRMKYIVGVFVEVVGLVCVLFVGIDFKDFFGDEVYCVYFGR